MKILLAIDGSPCSGLAVAEVCRRPWPAGTIVQVVTVDPPTEPALVKDVPSVFDEIGKRMRAEANGRLQDAVRAIEQGSPLKVLSTLLEGSPATAITEEALRWGADLIVVGSHGYGAIRRMFLGSVSLSVATNAPCSVLIVRGSPGA